jgi:hypothetical protein
MPVSCSAMPAHARRVGRSTAGGHHERRGAGRGAGDAEDEEQLVEPVPEHAEQGEPQRVAA